jgi:hypothetical protein
VSDAPAKADLKRYLQEAREALVWKLDGLSEYDRRRPLVRTGSNLLGLLKHCTGTEVGYFADTFGRPYPGPLPRVDDPFENDDMWARADESSGQIVAWYQGVWAHSDATIDELPLDAVGRVPWWPQERNEATLHHLLVRMIYETARHAGQADILRESLDGQAGFQAGNENLPDGDEAWWSAYRRRLEEVASSFSTD